MGNFHKIWDFSRQTSDSRTLNWICELYFFTTSLNVSRVNLLDVWTVSSLFIYYEEENIWLDVFTKYKCISNSVHLFAHGISTQNKHTFWKLRKQFYLYYSLLSTLLALYTSTKSMMTITWTDRVTFLGLEETMGTCDCAKYCSPNGVKCSVASSLNVPGSWCSQITTNYFLLIYETSMTKKIRRNDCPKNWQETKNLFRWKLLLLFVQRKL